MGRSLPVLNFPALAGTLGSIQQQVTQFFAPSSTAPAPHDGRTVFVVLAPAYGFAPQLTGVNDSSRLDMSAAHCTLLRYEPLQVPLFYRVKAWRILYATRDYADHPVASSGFIVLSDYASVASNQPIVAWAHPVTGIAQTCAPSQRSSPVTSIAGVTVGLR